MVMNSSSCVGLISSRLTFLLLLNISSTWIACYTLRNSGGVKDFFPGVPYKSCTLALTGTAMVTCSSLNQSRVEGWNALISWSRIQFLAHFLFFSQAEHELSLLPYVVTTPFVLPGSVADTAPGINPGSSKRG